VEVPHTDGNVANRSFHLQIPDEALSEQHWDATSVLRRPTYDILLQLKAEASPEANRNAELITAMEGNDRQSGLYEGGLKTWEGALDLATLLRGMNFESQPGNWHIIELGAGSAIPSLVALQGILAVKTDANLMVERTRFHLTLTDYNDEVLRLSTFANVLLASQEGLNWRQRGELLAPLSVEGSIDVCEDVVRNCHKLWRQIGVSFNFISGAWGKDFQRAISNSAPESCSNVLVLASETIYDLKSLPSFTDTVMSILRAHGQNSRAWVAAKKLYFGVGGGVDAFVDEVQMRGGAVRQIMNTKQGVSRVILEVTYQEP
jgi:protein-histidine N-methyltransferase